MKDVARSVVLGAAMISPGLLEACKSDNATPPLVPVPTATATAGNDDDAGTMLLAVTPDGGLDPADAAIAAPPTTVVRPRPDPTASPTHVPMPTRGFAGGARVRA
jgi:hypothetical protein